MSSGVGLFSTKDNFIIAVDMSYANNVELARKKLLYKTFFSKHLYDDFTNNSLDSSSLSQDEQDALNGINSANTDFLNHETPKFNFFANPSAFENNLSNNDYPINVNLDKTIHVDATVPDDSIDDMYKKLGFTFNPKDTLYKITYNNTTHKYVYTPNFCATRATVNVENRSFILYRNHFQFSEEDYNRITQLINNFQAVKDTTSVFDFMYSIKDTKDQALFEIYAKEYNAQEYKNHIICHELKHVHNAILEKGVELKDSARRLSVEDEYRLMVENERSAYLSQAILSINLYLKNGDLNNFSFFDAESSWIANKLRTLPESSRVAYVQNIPEIMKGSFAAFERTHKDHYDDTQFLPNMKDKANHEPLYIPTDDDRKDFLLKRRLFYQFKIYDPSTRSMINKSLADYISIDDEVKITPKVESQIIQPTKDILLRRKADYDRKIANGEIDSSLIPLARKTKRGVLHEPNFVRTVDGLSINNLIDEQDNSSHIPDDKAQWSDKLKDFWKNTNGYSEISKNNYEYSFNIDNQKIKYTAENKVNISENLKYENYVKLLQAPSNNKGPVLFQNTLNKEQALMLYVACINTGRKPIGCVPQDLSMIDRMPNIPNDDKQLFKANLQKQNGDSSKPVPSSCRVTTMPICYVAKKMQTRGR